MCELRTVLIRLRMSSALGSGLSGIDDNVERLHKIEIAKRFERRQPGVKPSTEDVHLPNAFTEDSHLPNAIIGVLTA